MASLIYFHRSFSKLIQMDAYCSYIALSSKNLDNIVTSELKSDYESKKQNFL